MSVPRRTTPARRLAAAVLLVVAAPGCTSTAVSPAPREPAPSSAPVSAYDDASGLVARDPCAAVTETEVADALGGDPESSVSWSPGERLPGTSEVADEHGCRHTAAGVSASAWVFAAPTSSSQARRMAEQATREPGCRRLRDVEPFGDPAVAFACDRDGGSSLTGMRGLVGTTWVSCEIGGTDEAERVERWCAAVLAALSAT